MAVDPVCGMTVDPARAAGRVEHEGTMYYFCSKGCAAKFTADPKKYLSGQQARTPPLIQIGGDMRRPGGSAEHPTGAASEHPGGAAAKHPGGAAAEHPGGAAAEHPGGAAAEHPGGAASKHPGGAASKHPGGAASEHPGASTEYTCPMHPEVVSDRPGACPKCGMALEPQVADLSDAPNPELVDMRRRFWTAVAFGLPVVVVTMADMATGGSL